MNALTINTLKVLRKLYALVVGIKQVQKPMCDQNPATVSQKIVTALESENPCMIARFGAFELATLVNYIGIQRGKKNVFNYIKGKELDWWWNSSLINYMHSNAGFFPPTEEKMEQFCELIMSDMSQVDILGSWLANETFLEKQLENKLKVQRILMEPFWADFPWTLALEGKKVLVIHPFTETIEKQYLKRKKLFDSPVLPEFELITIKAVQSIAGEENLFSDWFEALESMKKQMKKSTYDVCLIGAGAYGFSLAAYAKSQGKIGIHLGGSLQLLFGIKGKRWEQEHYNDSYNYPSLFNAHWVRPSEMEIPKSALKVEGACYW